MLEYFYIIREREFIRLNEHTYKIGRTKQLPNCRLQGYPKGSEVILFQKVDDCKTFEKIVKEHFKNKFKQRLEYGFEYFTGNIKEMLIYVYNLLVLHNDFINECDEFKDGLLKAYEITNDNTDRVCKEDLIQTMQSRMTQTGLTWRQILIEIKSLGLIYKRDWRSMSKDTGQSRRGIILGLKLIDRVD